MPPHAAIERRIAGSRVSRLVGTGKTSGSLVLAMCEPELKFIPSSAYPHDTDDGYWCVPWHGQALDERESSIELTPACGD